MQFMDWSVKARTVYGPQLCFRPYTILAWNAQSVNCHIAVKAMCFFFVVNITISDIFTLYKSNITRKARCKKPMESVSTTVSVRIEKNVKKKIFAIRSYVNTYINFYRTFSENFKFRQRVA